MTNPDRDELVKLEARIQYEIAACETLVRAPTLLFSVGDLRLILRRLASSDSGVKGEPATSRVAVPEGQTPLNDKLGHRYLDVIREGATSRDTGAGSPYHGHSLEHCLHSMGWVQRDLRLALDKAKSALVEVPVVKGEPVALTDAQWLKKRTSESGVVLKNYERTRFLEIVRFAERHITAPPADAGMREALERLKQGIRDIAQACVDGRVCDDVAWFTEIPAETLFDKCCNLLGEDLPTGQPALTAPGATTKSDGGVSAASGNIILPPKDFARVYSAINAAKDVLRGYSKIDYDADNNPQPNAAFDVEQQCKEAIYTLDECNQGFPPSQRHPSDPSSTRSEVTALAKRLDQVLKVMRGARNRSKPMAVWADDIKAVEDARALLDQFEIRRK